MQMVGCRHGIGCTLSLRRAVQTEGNQREGEKEREREINGDNIVIIVLVFAIALQERSIADPLNSVNNTR